VEPCKKKEDEVVVTLQGKTLQKGGLGDIPLQGKTLQDAAFTQGLSVILLIPLEPLQ